MLTHLEHLFLGNTTLHAPILTSSKVNTTYIGVGPRIITFPLESIQPQLSLLSCLRDSVKMNATLSCIVLRSVGTKSGTASNNHNNEFLERLATPKCLYLQASLYGGLYKVVVVLHKFAAAAMRK